MEPYVCDVERRPPKPGRMKPRVLRDAAGQPVIGYVVRDLLLEEKEEWIGRSVRYFRSAEYKRQSVSGSGFRQAFVYLHKKASILFCGSRTWHEARDVFARPVEGMRLVPLMKALRNFSHDFFWISAGGALERRATEYEARMPESAKAPREGWKLVPAGSVAALIGYSKEMPAGAVIPQESEMDAEAHRKEIVRRRERALQKAAISLLKHERELKRKTKIVERAKAKMDKLRNKLDDAKSDKPNS